MGKFRKPVRTRYSYRGRRVWSKHDRDHLLAWLNCCTESELDIKATAVDYLKDIIGKEYSWDQIQGKLRAE